MTTLRERAIRILDGLSMTKGHHAQGAIDVVETHLHEAIEEDRQRQFRKPPPPADLVDAIQDDPTNIRSDQPTASDALKAAYRIAWMLAQEPDLSHNYTELELGISNILMGNRDAEAAKAIIGDEPKT